MTPPPGFTYSPAQQQLVHYQPAQPIAAHASIPAGPTLPSQPAHVQPATVAGSVQQAQPSAPSGFLTGPADNTGQATTLPQAFTVGTLHDPTTSARLNHGYSSNHPLERLNLHVSSVSPLPKSYRDAFNDSNWQNAMCDEYHALIKNNTLTLVPRPTDTNIVYCMWLFRHKYYADGTFSRYKARIVANGSTQLEDVDVDETFSPVVKRSTIQTILSLATSRHWPVHQLDVKNALLHEISLWAQASPKSLVSDTAYLLLYVGDIVLTAFLRHSYNGLLDGYIRSFL
ncbi:ribonuclease H-like domain-containing protein [Tanacetum coccineum]